MPSGKKTALVHNVHRGRRVVPTIDDDRPHRSMMTGKRSCNLVLMIFRHGRFRLLGREFMVMATVMSIVMLMVIVSILIMSSPAE